MEVPYLSQSERPDVLQILNPAYVLERQQLEKYLILESSKMIAHEMITGKKIISEFN